MNTGMVYLVGAGPGDYKLISVKGLELIRQAECIIYDRLLDERLLEHARPEAELVYVGKAAGRHTLPQAEINSLLVAKAKGGRLVVRLKGGDPFVFGRGGEEALALLAAGIPFEVVPGITSATAVPAYAGIPVTHRGVAASFAVVTGHEDPAKPGSAIKWDKLSLGADTLVILMGVESLPAIVGKLLESGRPPATPAALIRWGTRPEQEVLVTTIGQAVDDAAGKNFKSPAVIVVGDVVTLRRQLNWLDKRPLAGRTVLITRAREQAGVLTASLEQLGAQCIETPAVHITPPDSYAAIDAAIANLSSYDILAFTSANGVDYFFKRLFFLRLDTRALSQVKVAAIGTATAARLRAYGIAADITPAGFWAEELLNALMPLVKPGTRVLLPRAAVARDILPCALAKLGAAVDVVAAYQTKIPPDGSQVMAGRLANKKIDLVTFTSASTVVNLLKLLGAGGVEYLNNTTIACIGPMTAAACRESGLTPTIVADESTVAGLVRAIQDYYKEA